MGFFSSFFFSFSILGLRWHLSCPQKLIWFLCNKAVISYAIKTNWCMSKLIIWLAINRAINEPQLLVSSYILILQLPNELSRLSGEETMLRKTHFTARETKFPHLILMSPPAVFKTFSSMMTRLSWGVRIIWAATGSQMWLSSMCKAAVSRTGFLYSEPTECPAPCLLLLCILTQYLFDSRDSPGPAQQLSANLLGPPECEQHWQLCSVDVGGKLHVAHWRCSHTVKGLHGCLQKGMQLVMKPLHSSCCSLLLHGHVDWWVAQPVPCPCRTVDSLAFLGRFYKKKPTVFEKGGDSGSRKGYWSDVERVRTGTSTWAWKVSV